MYPRAKISLQTLNPLPSILDLFVLPFNVVIFDILNSVLLAHSLPLHILFDFSNRTQTLLHWLRSSFELCEALLSLFDEEDINLFQGQVLGFWVAEEDQGNERQVSACDNSVSRNIAQRKLIDSLHMKTRYVFHLSFARC
jgi:hypothetical protein